MLTKSPCSQLVRVVFERSILQFIGGTASQKVKKFPRKMIFLCFQDAVSPRNWIIRLWVTILTSCEQGDFVIITPKEHCFSSTFVVGCKGTLKIFWFFVQKIRNKEATRAWESYSEKIKNGTCLLRASKTTRIFYFLEISSSVIVG